MNNLKESLSDDDLEELEGHLNYRFTDRSLLNQALTHSSMTHMGHESNERLEFLGDAVLEAVMCDYLYRTYPNLPEGRLSEIRSVVVSSGQLKEAARELKLNRYCLVSRGIRKKDRIPDSIMANLFEAVVAAIYLDSDLDASREFILANLENRVGKVEEGQHDLDYKSLLQQFTQKKWNRIPHYRITSEEGPDHDKEFEAIVLVRGDEYGPGTGSSKQEAEQEAARIAAEELEVEEE